jgi:protein-disulfide isomerase
MAGAFLSFGAGCESSGGDSDENTSDEASESSASKSSDDSQQGKTSPDDLYPGMNFSELDPSKRSLFVEVAKSELCPCDKSNQSLHGCLQKQSTQCSSAKRMGAMMAAQIQQGRNKEDLQSKIAEFQKELTESYEFSLENAPRKGPADAPVKIVEFADFQCPHCKRASEALKTVRQKFGDKVVHYFKHYPLKAHPQAELAARASIAAHRQGEFWPMHDLLFQHQRSLSRQKIMSFARQLGLNISEFKAALKAPSVLGLIRADKREARDADISGTPAIFINGQTHIGANSVDALSNAVNAALARQNEQSGEGETSGASSNGESSESSGTNDDN